MGSNGTYTALHAAWRVCALLLTAAVVAACALGRGGDEPFPDIERYEGREIEDVDFAGTGPFSADTLEEIVETEPTRCNLLGLPVCIPGTDIGREEHRLDADVLRDDVRRIELFYRASGYYGTQAEPDISLVDDDDAGDERVAVAFRVQPGDAVVLETLRVEGTEPVIDPDTIERGLPLQPGELFDYGEFTQSADSVLRVLRERGYAYADVLRNFDVDTIRNRATARLVALPGPLVVVDTIVVVGADDLGRRGALRQLAFEEGDIVRLSELRESQRNLYALELVQIATVGLSPDTATPGEALAAPPDPAEPPEPPPGLTPADTVPGVIVVTIEEAPVHVVDALVGFGTVECLRAQVEWISRSFGEGARRLALTGSVSKLGIGSGLGGSICDSFEGDPFRTDLDYRLSAEYTQPWLFTPRDRLTFAAFAERQSEPAVFQRRAVGGRVALLHELDPRQFLTTAVDVQRDRTRASPALFCLAFLVCLPEDIVELQRSRWRNTLSAGWVRDRLNLPVQPDSGHIVRTSLAWAAPWLGSDPDFVRWTGEGALRRPTAPDRTLAFRLRLGTFFGTATFAPGEDFLPPEDRFFAGGPSSVRGFARNELGPGAYVFDAELPDTIAEIPDTVPSNGIRFVPTGGTSVAVASVEYRFPALFARDRLRWAVFVDAGAVDDAEIFGLGTWRVTPGAGVRVRTPVGPIRLDLGYNPYGLPRGPLFAADPETGALVRVRDRFELDRSFWERLQLHLAIGEPF